MKNTSAELDAVEQEIYAWEPPLLNESVLLVRCRRREGGSGGGGEVGRDGKGLSIDMLMEADDDNVRTGRNAGQCVGRESVPAAAGRLWR